MSKILLQSHAQGDSENIMQAFTQVFLPVEVSYDKRSTEAFIRYESPKMLIFESKVFEEPMSDFIKSIRHSGFNRPIVIFTEDYKAKSFFKNSKKEAVHFLFKPIGISDLVSFSKKLLAQPTMVSQRYQRHRTEQDLDFEILSSGEIFPSRMTDLSLGGARCEVAIDLPIKMGDLVRLNVKLNELNHTRVVNAKVVWKSKPRDGHMAQGVGVKFISDNEMYKTLLGG